jgi:hypothetical protein
MVNIAVRKTREPGGLILENCDIRAMVESPLPRSKTTKEAKSHKNGLCRPP